MKIKKYLLFLAAVCILSCAGGRVYADEADAPKTVGTVRLTIDNLNKYEGMTKTYSEGYIPVISDGTADVVFPIICENGGLAGGKLRATLDLGNTENTPFVYKNYNRTIYLGYADVNDGTGKSECYMARFILELSADRVNGNYPVVLTVSASDSLGNDVKAEFTVYVTITDGSTGAVSDVNDVAADAVQTVAEPAAEASAEQPVFEPKMMISGYEFSEKNITAGSEVTAKITLLNTSAKGTVKNMTVTASADSEKLILTSDTDSVYIDSLSAGESTVVEFAYRVNNMTASGQYDITLSMDYADKEGNTYTADGRVKVDVTQETKLTFDKLDIADELVVSDTVEAGVTAINLGKSTVYNVRAVIAADGLKPKQTIFIGDIEAGTSKTAQTEVTVSSLTGNNLYGQSDGTVTFYYEDEQGGEYTGEQEFTVTVLSPFSEEKEAESADNTGQWYIIICAVAAVIVIFLAVFTVRRVISRRSEESGSEDE